MEKGAYDPSKIHKINFDGIYYKSSGYAQAHPSPQRTPVIFQAGSSESGKTFAGKHAEAIFCGGTDLKKLAAFVKEVRAIAVANGRLATDVNFFPMIAPIIGRTLEEAQAKHDRWFLNADWEGGLATISSFMNVGFSKYPLDEPFDIDGISRSDSAIHSLINSVKNIAGDKAWTPRMLGADFAFCGFGKVPVGTPEMIADVFEKYINETDIDGFNVACKFTFYLALESTKLTAIDVSNPESYEDLVELLIPVLQERGIMWNDYAVPGGTFRENLRRELGAKTLPKNHPGAQFRYDVLKGDADEFGDITITRKVDDSITKRLSELEINETVEAKA